MTGTDSPDGAKTFRDRLPLFGAVGVLAAIVIIAVVVAVVSASRGSGGASALPTSTNYTATPEVPVPTPTGTNAELGGKPANPAVPIGTGTAAPASGVSIVVAKLKAVQGTAELPGDVAGPSVQVTVTVTNSGSSDYSLAQVAVNAYYGTDRTPASQLPGPGGENLPHELAAGSHATGVYIFSVPKDQRSDFVFTMDLDATKPLVVFEGAAPTS